MPEISRVKICQSQGGFHQNELQGSTFALPGCVGRFSRGPEAPNARFRGKIASVSAPAEPTPVTASAAGNHQVREAQERRKPLHVPLQPSMANQVVAERLFATVPSRWRASPQGSSLPSAPEKSRGASCASCGHVQGSQGSARRAPPSPCSARQRARTGCAMQRPKPGCIQRFPRFALRGFSAQKRDFRPQCDASGRVGAIALKAISAITNQRLMNQDRAASRLHPRRCFDRGWTQAARSMIPRIPFGPGSRPPGSGSAAPRPHRRCTQTPCNRSDSNRPSSAPSASPPTSSSGHEA